MTKVINYMEKKKPLVVLAGRTNVGKSTLLNCLAEKHLALVSSIENTTRDSNLAEISWTGGDFTLVDTAGVIEAKYLGGQKKLAEFTKKQDIEGKTQKQIASFLKKADLILFVVDAKTGLLPQDREIAAIFKAQENYKKDLILVANKVDSLKYLGQTAEFNKLGLGTPVAISAATGQGTGDLLDLIITRLKKAKKISISKKVKEEKKEEEIKVCIVGQPNVGKSSLLNSILGYERVIVSPMAHTTREPQNIDITYEGRKIKLIDTAGITRHGKKQEGLHKHGILKSLKALRNSDIALLMLDISKRLTHQDAKLVEEIFERRKSLIILANKWDLVKPKDTKKFTNYIYGFLPFATWAPIQFISALTGEKVNKIFELILAIDKARKTELSNGQLDYLLKKIVKIHKPTKGGGIKKPYIYEIRQVKTDPPRFEVRIGSREALDKSYIRFIENQLRENFKILGTPLEVEVVKNKRVHGQTEEEALNN